MDSQNLLFEFVDKKKKVTLYVLFAPTVRKWMKYSILVEPLKQSVIDSTNTIRNHYLCVANDAFDVDELRHTSKTKMDMEQVRAF